MEVENLVFSNCEPQIESKKELSGLIGIHQEVYIPLGVCLSTPFKTEGC